MSDLSAPSSRGSLPAVFTTSIVHNSHSRRFVQAVASAFLLVVATLASSPKQADAASNCGNRGAASTSGTLSACTYGVGVDTFTAPTTGFVTATFDVLGAQGSGPCDLCTGGGLGGEAKATLRLNPGQSLQITVGSTLGSPGGGVGEPAFSGGCGFNGVCEAGTRVIGNGGGASDVRTGSFSLSDRVIVAGGGGGRAPGSSGQNGLGGAGGGSAGSEGVSGFPNAGAGIPGIGGGGGAGGAAGTGGGPGSSGNSATGGAGGTGACHSQPSGVFICSYGGGGGGGYAGGGGGGGVGPAGSDNGSASDQGGGGGGGSGFVIASATNAGLTAGVNTGDGLVTVFYNVPPPTTQSSAPSPSSFPKPTPTPGRQAGGPSSYVLGVAGTTAGGANVKTTVKHALDVGLAVMVDDGDLAGPVDLVRLGHVDPGDRTLPWDLHVAGRVLTSGRYVVALEIFGPDGKPSGRAFPPPALLTITEDGHTSVVMTSRPTTVNTTINSDTNWLAVIVGVILALSAGALVGLMLGRRRRFTG